ncbi:MAG: tetratricopeptide repeat protein [Bacteroidia bacterium]|nr:tetratricopeptide repeat protein [Bacteroidia bacterium]
MNSDRLKQLKAHLQEDPDDPFNYYALALEYRAEEPELARQHFEHILAHHPDYLPVYYHVATLYNALNLKEKAVAALHGGIALAAQTGQQKTRNELRSLLDEIMFD